MAKKLFRARTRHYRTIRSGFERMARYTYRVMFFEDEGYIEFTPDSDLERDSCIRWFKSVDPQDVKLYTDDYPRISVQKKGFVREDI